MAEGPFSLDIKCVRKTVTTDATGNATLFSGEIKKVLAVVGAGNGTPMCLVGYGYGNTYGKFFSLGASSPAYSANATYTIDIYYY